MFNQTTLTVINATLKKTDIILYAVTSNRQG